MGGPEQPAPSAKRPPLPRRRPRAEPYHPPFRQRRLDAAQGAQSTTGTVAQSRNWKAMKKHINGVINRVNQHNVAHCALDLFQVNIVRGRGVLCKALLRAQLASPALSPVFAALVAIIGSRMPFFAELLVRRLVAQLKAAYTNQDRVLCFATARFIAQLFNQQVVSELLLLEFLSTCMLDPSDGSVELAVVTLSECAVLLMEKSPGALEVVFQRIRELLHDGDLSRRAQVMIENLMNMRRTKFLNAEVLEPHLDLLEEDDIITHFVSLDDEEECDLEYACDEFHDDPLYKVNEEEYERIKRDILGAAADSSPRQLLSGSEGIKQNIEDNADTSLKMDGEEKIVSGKPVDMTESDLVDFRRTIYLTISSGISYEEWAHKLLQLMRANKGKELELCKMIIECCSQEKTYIRAYGLLGQRFCRLDKIYRTKFEDLFAQHYASVHELDTRKIRNICNFFASLLASEALPWTLLQVVRLVEEETTKSSRIFMKILFEEISRTLGEPKTKERFELAESEGHLNGVFPTDTAENARFSINFFSTIGLEFVTGRLRENLKSISESKFERNDDDESESSESESSSVISSGSDEEKDMYVGLRVTGENATSMKETRERRGEEKESVLDGRGVSIRESPQISAFQNSRESTPFEAIERGQAAYVNASTSTGAKRVAQRQTDESEERSTQSKKRRRYYSPERRPRDDTGRRGESSRYENHWDISEEESDYRRKGKGEAERYERRSSSPRHRSRRRRRRSRSSSSSDKRYRRKKYQERYDGDLPADLDRYSRAWSSHDGRRVRGRQGSTADSFEDNFSLRERSRSHDSYQFDRDHGRASRSTSRPDSEDYYDRLSREKVEEGLGSRGREDSPHLKHHPSPVRRDVTA